MPNNVKIKKQPTVKGLQALKVGGFYEVTAEQARQLAENGEASLLIETAMHPHPVAKRVKKSNTTNKPTDHPSGSKRASAGDE